jgi:glucose/arabinose dehydrogenase/plastocyanin
MFFFGVLSISVVSPMHFSFGAYVKAPALPTGPSVNDPNLAVVKVASGLKAPTSMAFVGPNDILVTEKNTGIVYRIFDGDIQRNIPALDVAVANQIERGLLGMAISKDNDTGKTYVFLYLTESGDSRDGSDAPATNVDPLGNRLYRYEYKDGILFNPVLLLDLTAIPVNGRAEHNGGKVVIGPDNNVYVIVGEVGGHRTITQNNATGPEANGIGGVIRLTQDGKVVPDNPIFGEDLPLSLYYGIGIRNSFGMDFDPLTGNLWDTENGPDTGDEVNLIKPGFNGGWSMIQGYADEDLLETGFSDSDVVTLGDSKYSDPKFVWKTTVGPTALQFLKTDKLGKAYENNMLTGDINNGYLYRYTLSDDREDIEITNNTYVGDYKALSDNEADEPAETQPLIFGQGFGGITDIKVGPDGYLYVLGYHGDLYKIIPKSEVKAPVKQSGSAKITDVSNITPPPNSTKAIIVGIKGSKSYSPDPIEINVGQTVTWFNGDIASHTVTSGTAVDADEGSLFDSNAILTGQHYSLVFDVPGTFPYYCVYHPSMVGEVHVNEPEQPKDENDQNN